MCAREGSGIAITSRHPCCTDSLGVPDRCAGCRRPRSRLSSRHAVREHLEDSAERDDRDLIRTHVVRVEVQADQLAIELKAEAVRAIRPSALDHDRLVLRVPMEEDANETATRDHRAKILSATGSLARSALRPAPRLSHRSRAVVVGLMRSLPAPSPVSSRSLRAKNAAFAKSI